MTEAKTFNNNAYMYCAQIHTWLEENREAEIDDFEGGILLLVCKQEVLGLEVPVHHAMLVAGLGSGSKSIHKKSSQ